MTIIQKLIECFFKRKWLGLLLVLALVIGVGVSTLYRGALNPKHRTDITVYLKAAEMIQIGRFNHIYGIENERNWHYVYSPFLAVLMVPAVKLPLAVNVLLAYFLSIGALAGTFVLSRSCAARPGGTGWQIALSAIICLPLFLNTLSRAQMGILMLFFSVLVFYCYQRRWKFLAGFLLSFAVAIKISPLAFTVFFFLFKKEWKILASGLLGVGLFYFVFPSLVVGFQMNWELLKIWQSLMAIGSSDKAHTIYLWSELFTPFANDNQSLYAVVTRLVWPSEAQFMTGSNTLIRMASSAVSVLLLGLLFLKKLPAPTAATEDRVGLFAEYSLYPTLMLFASPVTQIHHYANLYILFLAALFLQERSPEKAPARHGLLICFWVCAFAVVLGYLSDPLSLWGVPLWGSMLLWGAVFISVKK